MTIPVTIAVVTYNSSKFILETLESAYNQNYPDLELIISDDASKDNTMALAKEWITQPRVIERFSRIELITVEKNTGVSANCNRCIDAAKSDWIKYIAGDDVIFPNCVEDNMKFVAENPDVKIIFSQVKLYQDTFEEKNYVRTTPFDFPNNLMDKTFTAEDQYKLLLVTDRIHYTPSYFFNKKTLNNVGNYDEENNLVEDYPMWLKLTKSGIRLFYFHKITVGYRIHSSSTNNVSDRLLFKPSVFNSFEIRKKYAHPFLPWEMVKSEEHIVKVSYLFQKLGLNRKNIICYLAYHFAKFYLNIYHFIYAFKKRLPGNRNKFFYK